MASSNPPTASNSSAPSLASSQPPPDPKVGGPLDDVNDAFHDAYEGTRGQAEDDGPVFVVLGDRLVLLRRGERAQRDFAPRVFHVIKSAAHAPLAVFAALHRLGNGPLDQAAQRRVSALVTHLRASLEALDGDEDVRSQHGLLEELQPVLASSLEIAERARAEQRGPGDALLTFARSLGPVLLRLTEHATRAQLQALHAAVNEALAQVGTAEQRTLQVVVAGDHQARSRSLGMQYFRKRLGEPDGAEERVTYGEGVTDEASALALVGTRRADRAVAVAFFGDAKRLQRDVLGDAVHTLLGELDL